MAAGTDGGSSISGRNFCGRTDRSAAHPRVDLDLHGEIAARHEQLGFSLSAAVDAAMSSVVAPAPV
jgi:hypothetical protein